MSGAVLLCRHQPERVVGLAAGGTSSKLLVSVQGDGVIGYDTSRLASGDTRSLGSSQAALLAPVQQLDGAYLAALQPHGSAAGLLVASPVAAKQPKHLLDAEQRLPLPQALHSLHVLHRCGRQAAAGVAAVVLADGCVGAADFGAAAIRQCEGSSHSNSGGGGSGARQRGSSSAAAGLAAASDGQLLAVVRGPQGGEVTVDVFAPASSSSGSVAALQLAHSCVLACPSATSSLAGAALSGSCLALLWAEGAVTVYHTDLGRHSSSTPAHVGTFALPDGLLPADSAAADAAAGKQAGRKRRASEAAGGGGQMLCVAVLGKHLLLVSLAPRDRSVAWHAVLDSRFGCCLACGPLELEQAAGSSSGSGPTQLLALPSSATAPAALLAGGSVHLLHVPLPRADLAGLVAQLALAQPQHQAAAAQQPGTAASQQLVVAQQQLDLTRIAAAVSSAADAAAEQQACIMHAVPAAALAADVAAGADVSAAAQQLSAAAGKQPLVAAELRQAAQQLCAAMQQQQQQQQQQAAQQGGGNSGQQQQHGGGRRGRHAHQHQQQQQQQQPQACSTQALQLSQRLLAQGLAALAEVHEWGLLAQLHELQPLQSLAACPGLLPVLAAAHQYPLLRQLLLASQDVPAGALVDTVAHVLTPAAAGDGADARAAAAAAIKAAADAALAQAEAAVSSGDAAAASGALALARQAAAAVDGFSTPELLLHMLLAAPVDGVEAQAALRALPTPAVLRLLRYLSKWLAAYAAQPLTPGGVDGFAAAVVGGWAPPAQAALLVVPSWAQVLEWSRLLLDAHLTRLAMTPAAAPLLQRLQARVASEVAATSRLVRLKGVADHLAMGAPLPLVAEAASSQYTLELLDLRLGGGK